MTSTLRRAYRRRGRIAWQAPLALACGVLAVLALGPTLALAGPAYLALVGGELARIDQTERLLPNRLVLPGYPLALAGLALAWILGAGPPTAALACGLGYLLFLLVPALAGGIGMGDVKLAGLLGLGLGTLGPAHALLGAALGFVLGGAAALAGRLAPGGEPLQRIPLGPHLLAGFWAVFVLAATASR